MVTWDGGRMGGKPGPWCGEGKRVECALSSPWGEEVGSTILEPGPSSSFCCLLRASSAGRCTPPSPGGKEKGRSAARWPGGSLRSLAMSWSSLPSRSCSSTVSNKVSVLV